MLLGLAIRDVVLIDQLDLSIGPGLTALTGETGAGKSIVLDALGLACGVRAEAGLVRRGAAQAMAAASFAPSPDHAVWAVLADKGLTYARDEDLVLRRALGADGRSRAFVNDQPTSVGVLRELGDLLLEVHGQHETVGLLDQKTHRRLLDDFGGLSTETAACAQAWSRWRAARERAEAIRESAGRSQAEAEELSLRLSELDRLDPREGEETELAEQRAILGAAEKALTDIAQAREHLSADLTHRLAQAFRALERARDRAVQAGASAEGAAVTRITEASAAVDRAIVEATEAQATIDAAAAAFDFQPDQLDKAEERLFALRAMARKLSLTVDDLPAARVRFASALRDIENLDEALRNADAEAAAAEAAYRAAATALSRARRAAGDRLAKSVEAELPPLKLDKAKFRVAVEPLADDRAGPSGADRVEFEIATNPGAPFAGLAAIASGGELARFALALKVSLASEQSDPPLMIFDEVDQGVGGAVADAVGLRLRRLAERAQVLVVTHSPQVAARADAHWRVVKAGAADKIKTAVEVLTASAREEEIARMLAGAEITEAARAAARALIES